MALSKKQSRFNSNRFRKRPGSRADYRPNVFAQFYVFLFGLMLVIALAFVSVSGIFSSLSGSGLGAFSLTGSGIKIGGVTVGGSLSPDGTRLDLNFDEEDGGEANAPGCDSDNCLTTPDGGAYHGIAGEKSLRQAILNWTNFVLGFLGLIAMIALIFYGFLYITAHGDQAQADKGKKGIIWVTIGIIIILLAYAYVTTLIEDGPRGGDLVPVQTSETQ